MKSEILLFRTDEGRINLHVRLENETVWLTQSDMVELFQTSKQNISLHIKNIFEEGELNENSVVKEYLTTAKDGKKYKVMHYNLDIIFFSCLPSQITERNAILISNHLFGNSLAPNIEIKASSASLNSLCCILGLFNSICSI